MRVHPNCKRMFTEEEAMFINCLESQVVNSVSDDEEFKCFISYKRKRGLKKLQEPSLSKFQTKFAKRILQIVPTPKV